MDYKRKETDESKDFLTHTQAQVKGYLVEKVLLMQKEYRKKEAREKAIKIKKRETRRLQKLGLKVPAIYETTQSEKTMAI